MHRSMDGSMIIPAGWIRDVHWFYRHMYICFDRCTGLYPVVTEAEPDACDTDIICGICAKGFVSENECVEHMLYHTEEENLACNDCRLDF